MPKIYDIRDHQIIDADAWTMRSVISAALGCEFTLGESGRIHLETPDGSELTEAGKVFMAAFSGRRFASMEAVSAHVIDCQVEQLDMLSTERAELLECLEQVACCWGDIDPKHARDVRDRALAVIAKAKGEA